MKRVLDDMAVHFEGPGASYNETFFEKLLTCFAKHEDEDLVKSQNLAWKGMVSYYQSNGTIDDF